MSLYDEVRESWKRELQHFSSTTRVIQSLEEVYSKPNLRTKQPNSSDLTTDDITQRLWSTIGIWYLPYLSKEQATALLAEANEGNFIVRLSASHPNTLCLSLRTKEKDCCRHFLIQQTEVGLLNLQGSNQQFTSLISLLQFYILHRSDMLDIITLPSLISQCNHSGLSHFNKMGESFWLLLSSCAENNASQVVVRKKAETPASTERPPTRVQNLVEKFEKSSQFGSSFREDSPPPSFGESSNREKSNVYSLPTSCKVSPSDSASTIYDRPWDVTAKFRLVKGANFRPESILSDFRQSGSISDDFPLTFTPELSLQSLSLSTGSDKAAFGLRSYILQMLEGKLPGCEDLPNWISRFVLCVSDKEGKSAQRIMPHIRQFLSGLRNYILLDKRQGVLEVIQKEKGKLHFNKFLNINVVVDCLLIEQVTTSLRDLIYRALTVEGKKSGSIKQLYVACLQVQKATPEQLGLKPEHIEAIQGSLSESLKMIHQMTSASSPVVKLECLLELSNILFIALESVNCKIDQNKFVTLESFLPALVYVLAQANMSVCGIEAEYMEGLLPTSVLQNEADFYVNVLLAAVEMLKAMASDSKTLTTEHPSNLVRVLILDESTDTIIPKVFPLSSHSTTQDLCNLIAHRQNVYNPNAFSIYHYDCGRERILEFGEHPVDVKKEFERNYQKPCVFIYKRTNAFIVVPENLDF